MFDKRSRSVIFVVFSKYCKCSESTLNSSWYVFFIVLEYPINISTTIRKRYQELMATFITYFLTVVEMLVKCLKTIRKHVINAAVNYLKYLLNICCGSAS